MCEDREAPPQKVTITIESECSRCKGTGYKKGDVAPGFFPNQEDPTEDAPFAPKHCNACKGQGTLKRQLLMHEFCKQLIVERARLYEDGTKVWDNEDIRVRWKELKRTK